MLVYFNFLGRSVWMSKCQNTSREDIYFFFCGVDCVVSRPLNFVESDYSKVVLMSLFLLYISSKADILCICNRNIVSWWASMQQLRAQTTKKNLGQPKRNQLKIFLRPRRQFPKKAKQISSGNRTQWSLIRSVMWVINKIERLRSGSTICWLREWLQTESEDKKWKQKFFREMSLNIEEEKQVITKKGSSTQDVIWI